MEEKEFYISGGISARTFDEALAHFDRAEAYLKEEHPGCKVVNPMRLPHEHDKTWENYMRHDIIGMMGCNTIYMLTGFEKSPGALIEFNLAITLKFKVIFE